MKNIFMIMLLSCSLLIWIGCGDEPSGDEAVNGEKDGQQEEQEVNDKDKEQDNEQINDRETDEESKLDVLDDIDLSDYENDKQLVLETEFDSEGEAERFSYDIDGEFLGYDTEDFWNDPDSLISEYGEPEVEEQTDDVVGMGEKTYHFDGFEMNYIYFMGVPEEEEEEYNFLNAIIHEEGYPVSERDIQVGDHFLEVLAKYPNEMPDDPELMYKESLVGTRIEISYDDSDNVKLMKLVEGEEGQTPFGIDLKVDDSRVTEIKYYFAI